MGQLHPRWGDLSKPCRLSGRRLKGVLTLYAAQITADTAATKAQEHGLKTLTVKLKGPGAGRESAIRTIHNTGIIVSEIIDVTPLPHNGCRPPKKRRV